MDELRNDLPGFLLPEKGVNMHHLIVGTLLGDLLCYGGYKLGQYLDKDKDKENEKSNINSGKEGSKKTVPDKDKKPTLNENSTKSKI